jgi:hypothetical protein
MRKAGLLFALLMFVVSARAETGTLLTLATSRMATGTAFRIRGNDSNIVYTGTLVTHRAKNFFRRGSLAFKFDQAHTTSLNSRSEGVLKKGRKKQIVVLAASSLAAKLADDSVDGTIGAGKARYVGAASALAMMLFTNGGDVRLKPGFQVEIDSTNWATK